MNLSNVAMCRRLHVVLWILSVIYSLAEVSSEAERTYETLYRAGVEAYLDNRWSDCVRWMEEAVEDFAQYRSTVIGCRSHCRHGTADLVVLLPPASGSLDLIDNHQLWLAFYHSIVRNALCLMKCQHALFKNRLPASKETDSSFAKKAPYDYLQLCHFKLNDVQKAASYAYTFILHNPEHEAMQNNLKYYISLPNVDVTKLQYLEAKGYQELFLHASQAYSEQKYELVCDLMEEAIDEYINAEEECRFWCEGSFSSAVESEFIISVANHFTSTLRCKLNCPHSLSVIYGQKHDHFLALHFHYLQYAYYKIGKLEKACEAAASYLLLQPNDTTMLENKAFYLGLKGVQPHWFMARAELVSYKNRQDTEETILHFIEESFQFEEAQEMESKVTSSNTTSSTHQDSIIPAARSSTPSKQKKAAVVIKDEGKAHLWARENNVLMLMDDKDLNGSLRFAADGLVTQEECKTLMELTIQGAVHGDGYNGKMSPHTEFEMFEGLSVGRAATLAHQGILDAVAAQMFLNVSEKARSCVETYFDLSSHLYFAYTHLVCRSARPDSPGTRTDLSHPVHADNCVLLSDGQCLKQKPAYTWRDYSAIIYLNDDFEGGEFIFAKDKNNVQASVHPKCGRMVAFSAGKENLHGVQAVKRGRRCALAMWYTLDPNHKEGERLFAEHVLAEVLKKNAEFNTGTIREKDISFNPRRDIGKYRADGSSTGVKASINGAVPNTSTANNVMKQHAKEEKHVFSNSHLRKEL